MNQEVVPIQLADDKKTNLVQQIDKEQMGLKIKAKGLELDIYNGCERYIVYALLKELSNYAS